MYIDERMNDKNSIFKPTNVAKKIEEQSELQASRNLYNDLKQIFFNGFLRTNPKFVKDFTSSHNSNNFKPLSEKILNAMLNMMLNKSESKIFEISPFSEIAIARVLINPDVASKFNSNNIILTEQSLSKEQGIIVDRLHPHYNIVLPKSSIPLIKDNDTFYLNTSAINSLLNIFLPEIVINKEKMNYKIYLTHTDKINSYGDLFKGLLNELFIERLGILSDQNEIKELYELLRGKRDLVQATNDSNFRESILNSTINTQNIFNAIKGSMDTRPYKTEARTLGRKPDKDVFYDPTPFFMQ